jgi:hypothetical protein
MKKLLSNTDFVVLDVLRRGGKVSSPKPHALYVVEPKNGSYMNVLTQRINDLQKRELIEGTVEGMNITLKGRLVVLHERVRMFLQQKFS